MLARAVAIVALLIGPVAHSGPPIVVVVGGCEVGQLAGADRTARLGQALAKAQVAGLSRGCQRLLRNTVYARHGYRFKDDELAGWFAAQPWYTQAPSNELPLQQIDGYNLALIAHVAEGQRMPLLPAEPAALLAKTAAKRMPALVTVAPAGCVAVTRSVTVQAGPRAAKAQLGTITAGGGVWVTSKFDGSWVEVAFGEARCDGPPPKDARHGWVNAKDLPAVSLISHGVNPQLADGRALLDEGAPPDETVMHPSANDADRTSPLRWRQVPLGWGTEKELLVVLVDPHTTPATERDAARQQKEVDRQMAEIAAGRLSSDMWGSRKKDRCGAEPSSLGSDHLDVYFVTAGGVPQFIVAVSDGHAVPAIALLGASGKSVVVRPEGHICVTSELSGELAVAAGHLRVQEAGECTGRWAELSLGAGALTLTHHLEWVTPVEIHPSSRAWDVSDGGVLLDHGDGTPRGWVKDAKLADEVGREIEWRAGKCAVNGSG